MKYEFTNRLKQLLAESETPVKPGHLSVDQIEASTPEPSETEPPKFKRTANWDRNIIKTRSRASQVGSYQHLETRSRKFAAAFLQHHGLDHTNDDHIGRIADHARGLIYRREIQPTWLKRPDAPMWKKQFSQIPGLNYIFHGVSQVPPPEYYADQARIKAAMDRSAAARAEAEAQKKAAHDVIMAPGRAKTAAARAQLEKLRNPVPITAAQHVLSTGKGVLISRDKITEMLDSYLNQYIKSNFKL